MKPQEIYVKASMKDFTHQVTDGNKFDYVKPLTAYVFTEEEFEKLAGEIWDAAVKREAHHRTKYPDAFNFTLSEKTIPDKQKYLDSLKNNL